MPPRADAAAVDDTAGFIELYPPAASFSKVNPYAPGLITPDGGKPQPDALPSAGDPPRLKVTKEQMAQLQLEDEFITSGRGIEVFNGVVKDCQPHAHGHFRVFLLIVHSHRLQTIFS